MIQVSLRNMLRTTLQVPLFICQNVMMHFTVFSVKSFTFVVNNFLCFSINKTYRGPLNHYILDMDY